MSTLLAMFGVVVLLLVIMPALLYVTGRFAMRVTRKIPARPETIIHLTPLTDPPVVAPPATLQA